MSLLPKSAPKQKCNNGTAHLCSFGVSVLLPSECFARSHPVTVNETAMERRASPDKGETLRRAVLVTQTTRQLNIISKCVLFTHDALFDQDLVCSNKPHQGHRRVLSTSTSFVLFWRWLFLGAATPPSTVLVSQWVHHNCVTMVKMSHKHGFNEGISKLLTELL